LDRLRVGAGEARAIPLKGRGHRAVRVGKARVRSR
jgi:hypothetical protein